MNSYEPPVHRPASSWTRWLAFPILIAAFAGWLSLVFTASWVEDWTGPWLLLFGLTLMLTFAGLRLGARSTKSWRDRLRTMARFGFLSSVGAFLIAAWLSLLVAYPVPNSDILQPLVVIVSIALYGLGVISWLRGGEVPGVAVFLRRFGKTDLNQALARAARGRRRGFRFRLVTLDDRDFVPVSGERSPVLIGALCVVLVVALIAGVAYVLYNFFTELFGFAEASTGGVMLAMALGWLFFAVLLCLLPTLAFLGQAFWRSWAKRRTVITTQEDVKQLSERLVRNQSRRWHSARSLSSPRALVATTAHALWQEAVLELMKVADLVFLDLSDLSENVQWELDRLREEFPAKAVILLPEGTPPPVSLKTTSGPELRVVAYRSYSELEKALREIMAREALAPISLSGQEAA